MSNLIRQHSKWRKVDGVWPPNLAHLQAHNSKPMEYNTDDNSNQINAHQHLEVVDKAEDEGDVSSNNNLIGGGQDLDLTDEAGQSDIEISDLQWGPADNGMKPEREIISPIGAPKERASEQLNKQQQSQKQAQSSRPANHGSSNTSATNRITMLEEPGASSFELRPDGVRNFLSMDRKTIAPLSQLNGPKENDYDRLQNRWPAQGSRPADKLNLSGSSLATPNNDNLQQQQTDQYLLFLPPISAILLLLGLILHFAYRRRVRNGAKSGAGQECWPSLEAAKCCVVGRGARKRASSLSSAKEMADDVDFLGPDYTGSSSTQNFGCGGEQIRLVERRAVGAELAHKRTSTIKEEDSNPADEIIALDSEANDCATDSGREANTIVILQRRFAKNSLVVAAKSTKPKVRLITARVKRFIDDEADELSKTKVVVVAKSSPGLPLRARVFAYLSMVFVGPKLPNTHKDAHTAHHHQESIEMKESIGSSEREEPNLAQFTDEELLKPGSDRLDEMSTAGSGERAENLQATQVAASTSVGLTIPSAENLAHKPSQSPMLNEACSSISACSLFTPSPIENGRPACGCTDAMNGNRLIAGVAGGGAGSNWLVGGLGEPSGRSKSQGHSPCQLNKGSYHPCCLVSPAALNAAQMEPVGHHQRASYYYSHHCHQHPLVDHKLKLMQRPLHCVTNLVDKRSALGAAELMATETGNQLKSSSHIKRQYENYYEDDGQEDAYRRLTASIGMEFGHTQQIGESSAATLNYAAATANMDHFLPFGCQHYHQPAGHQPAGGSYLGTNHIAPAVTAATSLGFQDHIFQSVQSPFCKCCQPQPNAAHHLDELRLGQNSCPEQRTLEGGSQLANSSVCWNQGGSAGELGSRTGSTSLGGSDSGFISGAHIYNGHSALCNNPLCSCQEQAPMPAPPMSILVQQPSMATPPPPQQTESSDPPPAGPGVSAVMSEANQSSQVGAHNRSAGRNCESDGSTAGVKRTELVNPATCLSEKQAGKEWQPLSRVASNFKTCSHKAKWRHRRRLSHRHRAAGSTTSSGQVPARTNSRRLSMAGDQIHRPLHAETHREANCMAPAATQHTALQHRASIASEDSWAHVQQLVRLPSRHHNGHGRDSSAPQSHRPSDAALYEGTQFGDALNSKSNYSSSGGSSSGIGFSGSTCTNTPTSAFPQYDNFAVARQEPLIDFSQLASEHQTMACGYHQLQGTNRASRTNPLARENGEHLHEPLGSYPSRKFSLPVQLESQAAERVSPNRSRLLFEKNLQRVDSTSLSQGRAFPGEAVPVGLVANPMSSPGSGRQPQTIDSRRSSQTITRQSSFWLEDNSIDSVLSLATSGGPTEQQAYEEDCAFIADADSDLMDPIMDPDEPKVERPHTSQRPSIGSLLQSGDSIDSVKQRPCYPETNGESPTSFCVSPRPTTSFGPSHGSGNPRRNRLSSSSTSSTTSSTASPEFSKPSARLLGLASRSSSITKRHLGGKLRSRKFSRLSGASLEMGPTFNKSQPDNCISPNKRHESEGEEPEDQPKSDGSNDDGGAPATCGANRETDNGATGETVQSLDCEFTGTPNERSIPSDLNSGSLERQCRELWKLRATLQEDTCIADNWTNYHQRLNRRYDSGYKSIEVQLSCSLDGNMLAANANLPAAGFQYPDEAIRPQSGCSNLTTCQERASEDQPNAASDLNEPPVQRPLSPSMEEENPTNSPQETLLESVESKLAKFDLDDATLLNELIDRACDSRNSKSSEDERGHKIFDTGRSH